MKKIPLFCLSCFLGIYASFKLEAQTTIDAEFRPRTEFRQGFRKPLADTLNGAFVTFQRTRFNTEFKGKLLNARISLQDARIWGNSDNKVNSSKIEVFEAWFEYLITSGVSAQMGRQALKYDDQRLFGVSNWSNTGTAHDALVLKYNSPFIQIHTGFAYNNSKDTLLDMSYAYTPKQNYKTMGYGWLSKQLYSGTSLSLIGICEGFQNKTDYRVVYPRITFGGNLVYANDSSSWSAVLTAYHQSGKDPNKAFGSSYATLSSYFLAVRGSYKFFNRFTGSLGADYYSGSSATIEAGKSNTFNRLYGTNHSFNGFMEYFSTLPTQGLINIYGGFLSKLSPKLSADISTHLFYFDKPYYVNKVNVEKNLGTEADLTLNYVVSKEIALQLGYSRYFNSSSTTDYFKMRGIETHLQQWAYFMITIKPQLYKTPVTAEIK